MNRDIQYMQQALDNARTQFVLVGVIIGGIMLLVW